MGRIVDELLPRIVEDEVRLYFAEKMGLEESVMQGADFDVDVCLLRFSRPQMVMEVKWKGRISGPDIQTAQKSLANVQAPERILFVPDKQGLKAPAGLKLMDVSDLVEVRK